MSTFQELDTAGPGVLDTGSVFLQSPFTQVRIEWMWDYERFERQKWSNPHRTVKTMRDRCIRARKSQFGLFPFRCQPSFLPANCAKWQQPQPDKWTLYCKPQRWQPQRLTNVHRLLYQLFFAALLQKLFPFSQIFFFFASSIWGLVSDISLVL